MKKESLKARDVLKFHLDIWRQDKEMYMIWIFLAQMILAGIIPILSIVFPRYIIDAIANSELESTMILIVAFGSSAVIFSILQTKNMYFAEGRFLASRIRSNRMLIKKFAKIDFEHLENSTFHQTINEADSAMSNNFDGYQGTLSIVFYQLAELFSIVCLLIILGTFHYLIILVALGCSTLQFLLATKAKKYALSKHEEQSEKNRQADYFYVTANDFSYGKDIRINELEQPFTKLFNKKQRIAHILFREVRLFEYKTTLFDILFLMLTNGLTYYLIVLAYFNGGVSLGEVTMTILGVLAITTKLQATFKELARLKQVTGVTKKYISFMNSDEYETIDDGAKIDFEEIEIEFDHVSFHYPNSKEYVLKDVSFQIKTNQKIALVGINGSGKTTIVKLLCGLYHPTTGKIRVNGIDIISLNKEYLRKQIAAVFQDVNIYAGTIVENIAGENVINDDQNRVMNVLKEVGMYEKVMSLPNKENHQLLKVIDSSGIDLSGGETQKIAIARALYKENTKMMILDEPTAALDAIAEKEIYERFHEMTKNRTTLMISHRLASTRICDNILFLENGKLIEEGSHEELMNIQNGKYQEMFMAQGKYYQDGGVALES
jgi:ABC-type multidrug transport system fused ATPase/permease subunit